MVDAAVGGKTGINTAEGKNLVGSFHEPTAVLCDLASPRSLDAHEMVSGLAEVIKCGFIADADILDLVEVDPAERARPGLGGRARADPARHRRQGGSCRRRPQGGDVARLGMSDARRSTTGTRSATRSSAPSDYASVTARRSPSAWSTWPSSRGFDGRLDAAAVDRHRRTLAALGLPTSYSGTDFDILLAAMRVDKKARGDLLRFVVLDGSARPGHPRGPRSGRCSPPRSPSSRPR